MAAQGQSGHRQSGVSLDVGVREPRQEDERSDGTRLDDGHLVVAAAEVAEGEGGVSLRGDVEGLSQHQHGRQRPLGDQLRAQIVLQVDWSGSGSE